MTNMATFTVPVEVRHEIFSINTTFVTTIKLNEDEYDVTYLSPPPAFLTASQESSTIAQDLGLKTFSVWTVNDWEDFYLQPKNAILELIITPSKSTSLNITWTEIRDVLGDALKEVKHLHIVCSHPKRLVRLFMLPEAELVRVGQSCVEGGLFGDEVVASDRAVRESLMGDILVSTSTRTMEQIERTGGEVEEWELVEEEVWDGCGFHSKTFKTKAFERRHL